MKREIDVALHVVIDPQRKADIRPSGWTLITNGLDQISSNTSPFLVSMSNSASPQNIMSDSFL